jgi:hypothetical protein
VTDQDSLTKEEMQHLMPFLNEVPDCKICAALRIKLERMIKDCPKDRHVVVGGVPVTMTREETTNKY